MASARTLGEIFEEKARAGVSGLVVQTFEYEDALRELVTVCRKPNLLWNLAVFDCAHGMSKYDQDHQPVAGSFDFTGATASWTPKKIDLNIEKAIQSLPYIGEGKTYGKGHQHCGETIPSVLIMYNHQRWIGEPRIIQRVIAQLQSGKHRHEHLVFLSVKSDLPEELTRMFEAGHIQHPLPDRELLLEMASDLASQCSTTIEQPDLEKVVDSAAGLTRWGAENAFSLSIVRHGVMQPKEIFALKAEAIAAGNNAIEMYQGNLTLDDYGGAQHLKDFCLQLMSTRSDNPKFRPRGVFLVGLPGTGKTHLAKCLGSSVNRATAIVTLAAMKSRWQGASFENLTNMLSTLEAMSPLIALLDEIEGQVSGGKDTGSMDAGTGGQMNSRLLSWLSEKTADIFTIASCNDIGPILRDMPELTRAGRFDGMFFLDYPGRAAKDEIWKIHLVGYELLEAGQPITDVKLPDDENWTASEIEGCCRLAHLRNQSPAAVGKTMPTIFSQSGQRIEAIRDWADGRCYAAEYEGLYYKDKHKTRVDDVMAASGKRKGPRLLKQNSN